MQEQQETKITLLEKQVSELTSHIQELKKALLEKDFAYAEARALVYEYEGRIEKLGEQIRNA